MKSKALFLNCCCVSFLLAFATTPQGALCAPKVKWRCQQTYAATLTMEVGGKEFFTSYGMQKAICDEIRNKTNGLFDIELFSAKQLFGSRECFDAVKTGAIEMASGNGMNWCGIASIGHFDTNLIMGALTGPESYKVYFDPHVVGIMREAYDKAGVYYLAPVDGGINVFMTTFPLRTIADLKGKKIATTGPKAQWVEKMGAVNVGITGPEYYTALQRKTIDGIIYPDYTLFLYKFYEVVKYIIYPSVQVANGSVVINKKAWERLPEEYKEILETTQRNFVKKHLLHQVDELQEIVQKTCGKYGVEALTLKADDIKAMRSHARLTWEEIAAMSALNKKAVESYRMILGAN
jgi:TRAP-type C4-dicarboxylate transport system substrate-binding protein